MIDVTVDGKTYQEMHVDGGAIAQTFLYPAALTGNRARRDARQAGDHARAFIIRNGRLDPNGLPSSAARSASPPAPSPP